MRFFRIISVAFSLGVLAMASLGGGTVVAQGTPSAPSNVVAVDGASPGEVLLSWTATPEASFYRIGWVSYQDYRDVTEAGREWLEAFVFVDIANRGQTSYTVTRLAPGEFHAFIIGSAQARFGTAQWSEWATLTLHGAPTPSPGQPQVPSGATLLTIPDAPTVACYVGMRLTTGQGCIWLEPEPNPLNPSGVVAYQRISQGGDYHGQFITTWDNGNIWIKAADSDVIRLSSIRGRMNLRYRFWADREANDVWVVTKVNEVVAR